MSEKIKDILQMLTTIVIISLIIFLIYWIANNKELAGTIYVLAIFVPIVIALFVTANAKMYNQYTGLEKDENDSIPLRHNFKNYILVFIFINGLLILFTYNMFSGDL